MGLKAPPRSLKQMAQYALVNPISCIDGGSTSQMHPITHQLYHCFDLTTESDSALDDSNISPHALTLDEVHTVIQKLRHGCAAGPDGIPPERLKCAINSLQKKLFLQVWSSEHVPAQWTEGIIVALYKGKGPRNECFCYRPITLLSVPGKLTSC